MARRPLSPHLSIYRFGYTMSLSILHRFTGVGLSIGLLLFAVFLVSLARGEEAYRDFAELLPGWAWKLLAAPVLLSFVYHLVNGIRHLCWDAGYGFERPQAKRSAFIVIATVLLLGALALLALMRIGSGS